MGKAHKVKLQMIYKVILKVELRIHLQTSRKIKENL
jgi:hypothetical protein